MSGTRNFKDGKTKRICGLIAAIHPSIKTNATGLYRIGSCLYFSGKGV